MRLVIPVKHSLLKGRSLPPYTKREHGGIMKWKTPGGQWVPVPKGEKPRKEPEKGTKNLGNPEDVAHSLKLIREMYARRPKGQGTEMDIASEADLKKILKHTTFALMSADRDNQSKTQNKKRNQQLKKDLREKGFVYTPAKGMYTAPEESVMVMIHDADRNEVAELGGKYDQDSVAFADKGTNEIIHTTGEEKGAAMMRGEGYITKDPTKQDDDFYTDVKLATGTVVRFMLNVEEIKKALRMLRVWAGGR